MLFNSYEFIFFFLPVTFFIYFYLNQKHYFFAGKLFLIAVSLFFYSWWNIVYLPLILVSIFVNYFLGKKLARERKNIFLILGISLNLFLLGYFKYSDFFILNYNRITGDEHTLLHLALPLAISFYTFQQIAYLVDSYHGKMKEYNLLDYMVFVTFFPQLIAGPIVHHSEMMPQFKSLRNKFKNYRHISIGLFVFAIGLFKKVVIADTFSIWAKQGFDVAQSLNMIEAWVTSLSYTFQLYFDFSGYTDMAIGTALLFNIKLPMNFFSPYKATNIQDFWRRWHITLSRFLKDYIYIPLGGNRKGEFRTYMNLFMTFVLGGIWHGAGWTFVFWGALHGMALVIHRLWCKLNIQLPTVLAWFITFNFINIAWIFFRALNFKEALKVLKGMFTGDFILPQSLLSYFQLFDGLHFGKWSIIFLQEQNIFLWLLFACFIVFFLPNSMQWKEKFKPNFIFLLFTLMGMMSVFMLYRKSEFIYFNF